jgi:hypothetical protein
MLRGIENADKIAIRLTDGTVCVATERETMHVQIVERLQDADKRDGLCDAALAAFAVQRGVVTTDGRFVRI